MLKLSFCTSFAAAQKAFLIAHILRYLPKMTTSFEMKLTDVAAATETELQKMLPEQLHNRLRSAMRYAVLAQGKRLRPFYVVASADLFNIPRTQSLRVAAALECVHCYSLVHDDLPAMDNDDVRRGQPTLHRKFDEATAILAGDGLLTLAFGILAAGTTHPDAEVRTELLSALAHTAGEFGMVGGQMLDIEAETSGFRSIEDISNMQLMKTGALFGFACTSGAIMARQDQLPLQTYADKIGLAFQIADDLLDVRADAKALGKATQKDKAKGKATFVDLLGESQADRYAEQLVEDAIAALSPYGARAQSFADAARFVITRSR
jgi:farnesyl diphosphate synthase